MFYDDRGRREISLISLDLGRGAGVEVVVSLKVVWYYHGQTPIQMGRVDEGSLHLVVFLRTLLRYYTQSQSHLTTTTVHDSKGGERNMGNEGRGVSSSDPWTSLKYRSPLILSFPLLLIIEDTQKI